MDFRAKFYQRYPVFIQVCVMPVRALFVPLIRKICQVQPMHCLFSYEHWVIREYFSASHCKQWVGPHIAMQDANVQTVSASHHGGYPALPSDLGSSLALRSQCWQPSRSCVCVCLGNYLSPGSCLLCCLFPLQITQCLACCVLVGIWWNYNNWLCISSLAGEPAYVPQNPQVLNASAPRPVERPRDARIGWQGQMHAWLLMKGLSNRSQNDHTHNHSPLECTFYMNLPIALFHPQPL